MRLIIKGAVALFLLLAISIPLSAQYIVQGVVTDSLTREPLSYVSVRLKTRPKERLPEVTDAFISKLIAPKECL